MPALCPTGDICLTMPQQRIALISLGCPKNLVDSEVMLGLLDSAGYQIVEDVEQADIAICNTCAFIEPAQEEAIEALLDLAEMKATGGLSAIVCTGCLPQRHGPRLAEELSEVDVFVQIGAEPRIVEAVWAAAAGERAFFEGEQSYALSADMPRWRSAPDWLTYIRIADGCNHHCTYCTIPDIRGAYRSRAPEDIMIEYERLVSEGVREISLVAQDTTAYGRDLRPRTDLPSLLGRMAAVDFDGWVRLLYTYPSEVTPALLDAMAGFQAMVPYIDVPLQHASRRVLRAMGRAGDAESYLELVASARNAMPDIAIRTTFIVGFPGETEDEFEELLEFVGAAGLDRLSAFVYCPEPGTPAADLPGQVDLALARDRLDALMRAQEALSLRRNQEFVGRRLRVLIERKAPDRDIWFGRSYRDAPEIDCEVKVDAVECGPCPQLGEFMDVEVTRAEVHDLNAVPV